MRSSDTAITTEVRGEGFEPPSPGSKPGSLPLADPRSTKSALRESNSPRQLGRLEPLPLGQGHVKAEGDQPTMLRMVPGRCPSRTPKALLLDRFRGGCHRQLACPSVFLKAAVAGIEPASGRLTAAYPYQHGSHRKTESAWPDLNRRSRAPEARGIPSFPTRRLKAPSRSRTGTFCMASR
jgi:hypothetical protein